MQAVATEEPGDAPAVTLFAQAPAGREGIVARLRRQVADDERLRTRASAAEVDRAVVYAVDALWTRSRIKLFVPVLAMRSVRETLGVESRPAVPDATADAPPPPPGWHDQDELILDVSDDLSVSEDETGR